MVNVSSLKLFQGFNPYQCYLAYQDSHRGSVKQTPTEKKSVGVNILVAN